VLLHTRWSVCSSATDVWHVFAKCNSAPMTVNRFDLGQGLHYVHYSLWPMVINNVITLWLYDLCWRLQLKRVHMRILHAINDQPIPQIMQQFENCARELQSRVLILTSTLHNSNHKDGVCAGGGVLLRCLKEKI